jgi:hypothetical protein
VNELRQALGESGRGISSIRTVHARGYQFVARIEIVDGALPLPSPLADALIAHVRDAEPDLESLVSWLRGQIARREDDSEPSEVDVAKIASRAGTSASRGPSEVDSFTSARGESVESGRKMKKVEPDRGDGRIDASEAWSSRSRTNAAR